MKKIQALILELCSLPNSFCSFPTEKTKIPLHMLTQYELTHIAIYTNVS